MSCDLPVLRKSLVSSDVNRLAVTTMLGVVLMSASACSNSNGVLPKPPPNAGAVMIHAKSTAGPCNEAGRCAEQGAMGKIEVVLFRVGSAQRLEARTNEYGDAAFWVAPGMYQARFTRGFLQDACGAGASVARL